MPDNSVSLTFYTINLEPLWSTNNVTYLQWTRTVNALGSASLDLPKKAHDFEKLLNSRVMVISTNSDRGTPNLETAWFLTRLNEIPLNDGRSSYYQMIFEDSMHLFDNRIIPFRANFPRGSEPRTRIKTIATRAMEQVYDVALGLQAGADRVLEPEVTNKSAITAVAPVISKEIPWKRALTTLKQIAKSSRDQGTPIYFDLLARISGGSISFLFQTYANQRGHDYTSQIITSDDPLFILNEFSYNFKTPNVAYVGGSGRGETRVVGTKTHPNTLSIERYEIFRSAQSSNQDLLEDEASHLINNTSGRVTLSGKLLGNLAERYGFGDRMTLQHHDLLVPSEISSVMYTLENEYLKRDVIARSTE